MTGSHVKYKIDKTPLKPTKHSNAASPEYVYKSHSNKDDSLCPRK